MTRARWWPAALVLSMAAAHAAPPDLAAGKAAFQTCASCHTIGPGARGSFGPQLNGIVGRKAGSTTDFAYSAVLKHANFSWSEHNLAGFLRNPGQFVPGNKMRFWGIGDERELANLIAYLKTLPATTAGK